MSIFKTIFQKKDNSSYNEAIEKLSNLKKILDSPKYKDIYITEIHF